MPHVFVTRRLPGRAVEQLRKAGHTVDVWEGELPPPPAELRARSLAADAVLALLTDRFDADLLEQASRLRIVANMAVGFDNIDPRVAADRGIWVTNTPGVLAETTADFAFALLLAAARNVVSSDRDTRAGGWKTWSPTAFLGPDVHRATLGIVGMGGIGQAVARRARGFEMRLLYTSRTRKPALERSLDIEWCTLESLLAGADFVSLHVPLSAETHHLIGARELALMQPSAILVNTARGQVVDQEALVDALRRGQLAGAALDVTDPEPLPLDHPLFSLPNVVITPHIASGSLATRARMAEMAAANIIAVLAGQKPPNPVNLVNNMHM
ncbi:MAG: D-glycerate dehydrogenase [Dehalococcoidia bacterium]|nr:D-glycerate dehydrogenase [Dehalococcoidia bacterium]